MFSPPKKPPMKKAKLVSSSPKRSRIKEARETRLLFEAIATKLLNECSVNSNNKLENHCTDLINRKFTELRQDVGIIESTLSSRIVQLDTKLNDLSGKLSELSTDANKKNLSVQENVNKLTQQISVGFENERNKRLTAVKKLHIAADAQLEHTKTMVSVANKDYLGALTSLNEDFRVQSKEIARLKENMDDILVKRYGFVPSTASKVAVGENLANSFNQGLDAGVVLDNLAQRVKNLEIYIAEEEAEASGVAGLLDSQFQRHSLHQTGRGSLMSPPRSPLRSQSGGVLGGRDRDIAAAAVPAVGRRLVQHKIRRLEDSVFDLLGQLQSCEADIQEVKSTIIARERKSSPGRGRPTNINNIGEYRYGDLEQQLGASEDQRICQQDVRSLQRKMKKLAENTTRACRSLSSGLTEVQQATLNLYSWSDSAHDAFGKISHELGLQGNVCIRARVYHPVTRPAAMSSDDFYKD